MRVSKYPTITGVDWRKIRDKNVRQFLAHVYAQTHEAGIVLEMRPTKTLRCGVQQTNGYFEPLDEKVLVVAVNKPVRAWLRLLVHEYSHFEQWRYAVPAWSNSNINGADTSVLLGEWFGGRDFSDKMLSRIFHGVLNCELDCERIALENVKRFELPFDAAEYARQASAYMYFHAYAMIRRRWYRRAPYTVPEVLKVMPTTLSGSYTEISPELVLLFDKHC